MSKSTKLQHCTHCLSPSLSLSSQKDLTQINIIIQKAKAPKPNFPLSPLQKQNLTQKCPHLTSPALHQPNPNLMSESWRMQIGLNLPRRRSTEETSKHRVFDFGHASPDSETLDAEDFNDVFGGPPRLALSRKHFGSVSDFNLYEDVFRSSAVKKDRTLPVFRVPAMESGGGEGRRRGVYRKDGFYDDIFGSDEDRRTRFEKKSKSKSKSKSRSYSSSMLSSEELSPHRLSIAEDDVFVSSFSSKLRPVEVPSQRNSSSIVFKAQKNTSIQSGTTQWHRSPLPESYFLENNFTKNRKSSPFKFFPTASSPETITIEPSSNCSMKAFVEDTEIDSPSSGVSSLYNCDPDNSKFQNKAFQEEEEVMGSYVIEISCEKSKGTNDESLIAIDEAIAWAKEKFQKQSLEPMTVGTGTGQKNASPSQIEALAERQGKFVTHEHCNKQFDVHGRLQFLMVNEKLRNWMTEENQQSGKAAGWL